MVIMMSREQLRKRVQYKVKDAPQNAFNIFDDLADLLKGINKCVANYVKKGNELLISANAQYTEGTTLTKYDDECMLDYIRGFRSPNAHGYKDLNSTLSEDKRLKNPKYLKQLKADLETLFHELSASSSQEQYRDHDDFAEEENSLQNLQTTLVAQMREIEDFITNLVQNLQQQTTPNNFLSMVQDFEQNVNAILHLFQGVPSIDQSKIQNIQEVSNKVLQEDFRFVSTIIKLKEEDDNTLIKLALSKNFKCIDEIDISLLPESIIPLVEPPKTKINGSLHSEYRIIVVLDEDDIRNLDCDYIGISQHCCAMCYYIIHKFGGGTQVAGTHKKCDGAALVGMRLHTKEVQEEIIYDLFPELYQQQDVDMLTNSLHQNTCLLGGSNINLVDPMG